MAYAKIVPSGCGVYKNRGKLRLDFFLSPSDPYYTGQGNSFHSHILRLDLITTDNQLKAKITEVFNYFYQFHQYCWNENKEFIGEWKKVAFKGGSARENLVEGNVEDVPTYKVKVADILSRVEDFEIVLKKPKNVNLNIGEHGTIDVGSAATDRGSSSALRSSPPTYFTRVEGANSANDSGTIDTVEAWFNTAASGNSVKYGTFEDKGSNLLLCHDAEEYGEVSAGSKQTCTGLSIAISSGEYIGADARAAVDLYLEADTSGGTGIWWKVGQFCDPTDEETFAWAASYVLSLYGTGDGAVTFQPWAILM